MKNKMFYKLFAMTATMLVSMGFSQITGKVVNANGIGQGGCVVYSGDSTASTVTGATGDFSLNFSVGLNGSSREIKNVQVHHNFISFQLEKSEKIQLSLYNIGGRHFATVIEETMEKGKYTISPQTYLKKLGYQGVSIAKFSTGSSEYVFRLAGADGIIDAAPIQKEQFVEKVLPKGVARNLNSLFVECDGSLQKKVELSATSQNLGNIVVRGRPNIIFLFADDWGYGDLGVHGHPTATTPTIDKMAAEGIDFNRFTVSNPVCSPSRAAIYTGHYPVRHNIHAHFAGEQLNADRGMPNWLPTNLTLLPRLFQDAGYRTGHFGKWHLVGFESFGTCPPVSAYGIDEWAGWNGPNGKGVGPNTVGIRAAEFIEANKDEPFLMNVWLRQTHTKIAPTDSSIRKFQQLADDEPRQMYNADLNDGDAIVRQIMDKVQELGLDSQTLVIFSSDNGPEQHAEDWAPHSVGITGGLIGRKRYLNEGGIRVPFIARWPGVITPGKSDSLSILNAVDVLPTFCDIAGISLPGNYNPDGISAKKALMGLPFTRNKPIFWEWRWAPGQDNWADYAVSAGGYKLLMDPKSGRTELYNLIEDGFEKNNLASEQSALADSLKSLLDDWRESL